MNVRLKYDMHFTAGVWYNQVLTMNNYNLRLWMTTNSEDSKDQSTAFERVKYFVYSQIDNTIFINQAEQVQCQQLVNAGLNVTTMPGDPVDQLIGIMLYYKLNAIAEDRMIIAETEISSAHGEHMTYLHSDFENTLGYDQPSWWTMPDLSHNDIVLVDSEKIVAMSQGSSWRDLDLCWNQPTDSDANGNIVVFADFKPAHETK